MDDADSSDAAPNLQLKKLMNTRHSLHLLCGLCLFAFTEALYGVQNIF